MAEMTTTYAEVFYQNVADFTAHANSATEGSLLTGPNMQPTFPANFLGRQSARGKAFRIEASGILATTVTPTIIFQTRLGTTQGATDLTGTSVGVSAAITTGSGVTNQFWHLWLDITCNTPGQGTNNATLNCHGAVICPGGFVSPFAYALLPTTPPTGTWTATLNGASTQYFNLSATWSAASASNTITCKTLRAFCLN